MLTVLIPETFFELCLHLVLVKIMKESVLLIHPELILLIHHIDQFRLIEPAHHIFGDFIFRLNSLKGLFKGHVKFIKIRFTLYENHSRKIIKLCKAASRKILVKGLLQRQPFT